MDKIIINNVTEFEINDDSINEFEINDDSITEFEINDDSINEFEINDGFIKILNIKDDFIKEFGFNDDFINIIIKIIIKSYNNIFYRIKKQTYIDINQKDCYSLWNKKNYKYNIFISKIIGKIFKLYNFNNEYSLIIKDKIINCNIKNIDNNLKNNGYHILDKKIDKNVCNKIKSYIQNIDFHPFNSCNIIIKGYRFLDKSVSIDESSTYWVNNQDDLLCNVEIRDIVTDPLFLKIAQNYLGCNPILCQTNLWYSCSGDKPEGTQKYHQDYDDINFLKIFIYLSDVDEDSGPHYYISNSINNIITPYKYKPSTRLSDTFIQSVYSNENIKCFTGTAGTIILENTYGFHKGGVVKSGNRLMLQLQYSSTLLPFQQGNTFSTLEKNEFMNKYPLCFLKLK